jgi:hypothetical protein
LCGKATIAITYLIGRRRGLESGCGLSGIEAREEDLGLDDEGLFVAREHGQCVLIPGIATIDARGHEVDREVGGGVHDDDGKEDKSGRQRGSQRQRIYGRAVEEQARGARS